MASAFSKQHAARENVDQVLAYLGGGATVASNKLARQPNRSGSFQRYRAGCPWATAPR